MMTNDRICLHWILVKKHRYCASILNGLTKYKQNFAMLDEIWIANSFVKLIQYGGGDVTCTPRFGKFISLFHFINAIIGLADQGTTSSTCSCKVINKGQSVDVIVSAQV
jgi:hypothetical protein